jgi:cobalt-zinc-cadmium efflux system outer membrane protein
VGGDAGAGGGDALVANVNLPLPLFDRNQDAIEASRTRTGGAEASVVATRLALTAELAQALARAEGAELRRAALVDDALPAAIEAERGTRKGYDAGKFNLTTALDARSALIDVQFETIRAGLAARLAEAEARALASAAPFNVAACPGDPR